MQLHHLLVNVQKLYMDHFPLWHHIGKNTMVRYRKCSGGLVHDEAKGRDCMCFKEDNEQIDRQSEIHVSWTQCHHTKNQTTPT